MLGSFVNGTLADLSEADLARMLTLDESLFVEHKRDLGNESHHQLIKAVAAFANTLGGWLLVGVQNGQPHTDRLAWAGAGDVTLADAVRDRLRGELDPLPAFEARVFDLPAGQVGVVRVYESSDAPHVTLRGGSVYVREGAGDSDLARQAAEGKGAHQRRVYQATQIRTRAQLLELVDRGARARARVEALLKPGASPLLATQFSGLLERGNRPFSENGSGRPAVILVRAAPLTLPERFHGWATTHDAGRTVLEAAESLAHIRGLGRGWLKPHPDGITTEVGVQQALLRDGAGFDLDKGSVKVLIDRSGVVAAALALPGPEDLRRRGRIPTEEIAERLIAPPIRTVAAILERGEFLGRARYAIDLVGMPNALLIEHQGDSAVDPHIAASADLFTPPGHEHVSRVARLAANALSRGLGLEAFDTLG